MCFLFSYRFLCSAVIILHIETRKTSETGAGLPSTKKRSTKSDSTASVGKTRGMSPGFNYFKEERKRNPKGEGIPKAKVDDLKVEWEKMSMEEKQVSDALLLFGCFLPLLSSF
jgi:hypothetical protein